MLMFQIAALTLVTGVLVLTLRKDQPVFAFFVSICGAGAVLLLVSREMQPLMELFETLIGYTSDPYVGCVLRVLGISLVMQFAADLCRESGLGAAAHTTELGGRMLALLQALPLFQELVASLLSFLQ